MFFGNKTLVPTSGIKSQIHEYGLTKNRTRANSTRISKFPGDSYPYWHSCLCVRALSHAVDNTHSLDTTTESSSLVKGVKTIEIGYDFLIFCR